MLIKVLSKSFCISLYVNCEVRKHLALVFTIQRPHLFLFQRWLLPHTTYVQGISYLLAPYKEI